VSRRRRRRAALRLGACVTVRGRAALLAFASEPAGSRRGRGPVTGAGHANREPRASGSSSASRATAATEERRRATRALRGGPRRAATCRGSCRPCGRSPSRTPDHAPAASPFRPCVPPRYATIRLGARLASTCSYGCSSPCALVFRARPCARSCSRERCSRRVAPASARARPFDWSLVGVTAGELEQPRPDHRVGARGSVAPVKIRAAEPGRSASRGASPAWSVCTTGSARGPWTSDARIA
jgi:hypothetical protein